MTVRILLLVLLLAALVGVVWVALGPEDVLNPDRQDEPDPDPNDAGKRPGPSMPPPPTPGQQAVGLLRETEEGKKQLSDLATTAAGAREIIAALSLASTAQERARLHLHLLLGGTEAGRKAVLAHAREKAGSPNRLPAVLALAGGTNDDVAVLLSLLPRDSGAVLYAAIVHALGLRGDDGSCVILENLLTEAGEGKVRRGILDALIGAPGEMTPDAAFLELLRASGRAPGLVTAEPTSGPYRRLVDRIAQESEPGNLPLAVDLLLTLPGPVAMDGVFEVWKTSGGEEKRAMTDRVADAMEPHRKGAAVLLIGMARETKGEEGAPVVDRLLHRIGELGDADALPALEDWVRMEENPERRQRIEAEIERIRHELER